MSSTGQGNGITRRGFLRTTMGGMAALAASGLQAAGGGKPEATRPNIVLIMADDMGFSDLGCYGGEIQTPRLDALSSEGIRFSQFHNNALCGPSRASLMTGVNPHAVGIGSGWTGLLRKNCVTLPELLKQAGYCTNAVGRLDMTTADKWHDPKMLARHLDHLFGSTGHKGPGNYFKAVRHGTYWLDAKAWKPPAEGYYRTDANTDHAVRFVHQAVSAKRPFFLYCAYAAPHWPLHAKPDDIAKFRHLYRKLGWDNVRAGRCKRLVELGLVKPGWKPTPRDKEVPAWKKAKHKDWEAERMAVFAAQVHGLDRNIGRILDALRESGVERNTLVFFLSDNGPSHQAWNRPLDKQGDPWRRDGVPTKCGNKPSIMPGGADTFVTYGRPWANVSATPFRGYKGAVDEGSTATPLIVRWPQTIAKGGTITHQVGHITDIMATCLEVARVPYPETFRGRTVLPLEGESLLPILQGRARPIRRPICWELRGHRAVRVGRWKLVGRKKQPWRLYDMEADRTEMHDVSANQPDRVRDMAAAFAQWRKG